jgi:ATP synthase protein I
MAGSGKGAAGHEEIGRARATGLEQGYTVAGYMFSGLIAYGAIGWLIGRATHIQLLFPLGMVFGIAVSVSYVIYRFGRQGAAEQAAGRALNESRNEPPYKAAGQSQARKATGVGERNDG